MSEVLHDDDVTREGNMTADEYEATYADGPWCGPPADEVALIEARLREAENG